MGTDVLRVHVLVRGVSGRVGEHAPVMTLVTVALAEVTVTVSVAVPRTMLDTTLVDVVTAVLVTNTTLVLMDVAKTTLVDVTTR